jgi:hypothetical protein
VRGQLRHGAHADFSHDEAVGKAVSRVVPMKILVVVQFVDAAVKFKLHHYQNPRFLLRSGILAGLWRLNPGALCLLYRGSDVPCEHARPAC